MFYNLQEAAKSMQGHERHIWALIKARGAAVFMELSNDLSNTISLFCIALIFTADRDGGKYGAYK